MPESLTQNPARDRLFQEASDELNRRLAAGEARAVEAVLTTYPELAADHDCALQLIYDELIGRERRGERPDYEEYYRRFPHWQDELRKSFDIHEALVRNAADADALPNPSAARRYELLGEIGRGGMGVVYQARQPGLNRIVALKMILAGEYASAEELARFRREAETAARLQHPNIVQVYEVGEQDGRPFLAMEYVEGGSLAERIKGTLLTASEAARLLETLGRTVQYAHEQGVLHRDLKPSNILLGNQSATRKPKAETRPNPTIRKAGAAESTVSDFGFRVADLEPKVTDFGLAKLLSPEPGANTVVGHTQTGAAVGTPNYMAPEQARGALEAKRPEGIGPAVDVWALGVILYEVLTGRSPFQAETVLETLRQVESAEPLSPSRLRPKLPRDLETICLKCLEKDPRKRYANAGALADDLHRYRTHQPITARPVSSAARAWRWCQRKPAVASLAAALTTVVIASLVGLTFLLLRAERFGAAAETKRQEAEKNLAEANRQHQRAQTSYQVAREGLEKSVKKVVDDPRLASGPLEDLRRTVLQAETLFYQQFVELQGTEPDFQLERGLAFSRLGDVTRELGDQKQALDHYRHAHDILSALARDNPTVPKYQSRLAANQRQLAQLYQNTNQFEAAEQTYQAALTVAKTLADDHPEAFELQLDLARTYLMLGGLQEARLSRAREATVATYDTLARSCEESYGKALTLLDDLVRKHPTNLASRHPLGSAHISLGNLYYLTQRLPDAERALKRAETILREFIRDHAGHDDVVLAQKSLANGLNTLANIYRATKKPRAAEQVYWNVLAIQQQLVRQHPLVMDYVSAVGNTQSNFGDLTRWDSRPEDALDWFAEAITTLEPLVTRRPHDTDSRASLRDAHVGRAAALLQLERHAEALPHLDRTLELDDGRFRFTARLARAQIHARLGEHVRATAEASALVVEVDVPGARKEIIHGLYHGTACVYALAAAAVPADDPLFERYAAEAVNRLRKARDAGYTGIERWKSSLDLGALRGRKDFDDLFREPK